MATRPLIITGRKWLDLPLLYLLLGLTVTARALLGILDDLLSLLGRDSSLTGTQERRGLLWLSLLMGAALLVQIVQKFGWAALLRGF